MTILSGPPAHPHTHAHTPAPAPPPAPTPASTPAPVSAPAPAPDPALAPVSHVYSPAKNLLPALSYTTRRQQFYMTEVALEPRRPKS